MPGPWLAVLGLALCALLVLARVQFGTAESFTFSVSTALQGIAAVLDLGDPVQGRAQIVIQNRLVDAATALLVGASLGLSGALLQGLFRNHLASPGLIGVSSGASLGAVLGIVAVGGLAPDALAGGDQLLRLAAEDAPLAITAAAFIGAVAVAALVTLLASRGGRVSVPTLLLIGVAVNACLGGVLAAIQDVLVRENWEVARAVFTWLFGSLSERTPTQVAIAAVGLGLALVTVPLVARELDLFAGGEETAASLGVAVGRTKLLCLVGASMAAASAVAVAGQIAFVGLVVPHIVRALAGTSHRRVLPLSAIGGAVLLLGAEVANHRLLGDRAMRPGIVLSLLGGPFFLGLLLKNRREVSTW